MAVQFPDFNFMHLITGLSHLVLGKVFVYIKYLCVSQRNFLMLLLARTLCELSHVLGDIWGDFWVKKTQNESVPLIHGGSIKNKPNCLCHIYLMPNHIILKLRRYLENSIKNMILTNHNILFNR